MMAKPNPNDYPFTCFGDDQYIFDLQEWEHQQRQESAKQAAIIERAAQILEQKTAAALLAEMEAKG